MCLVMSSAAESQVVSLAGALSHTGSPKPTTPGDSHIDLGLDSPIERVRSRSANSRAFA
jgi:hypothetical protein